MPRTARKKSKPIEDGPHFLAALRYKGRKPIERPDFQRVTKVWCQGELTTTQAMQKLGVSKATFYRKTKRNG